MRVDHWIVNMNENVNYRNACDAFGIDSNTYIGRDVIMGANNRAFLNLFNAENVARNDPNVFLPEYVSA